VELPKNIPLVAVGDQPPGIQGGVIYDNTTDTNYYFPPPAGANPIVIADDVILPNPAAGTAHVNSFTFGYATNNVTPSDVTIIFYGGLINDPNAPERPDQNNIAAAFTVQGLPASPDGNQVSFEMTVDLAGQALDFDWPASRAGDGTNINWLGFSFTENGYGLLTATGGGSHDKFWSDKRLMPPFDAGDGLGFLWFFTDHTPEASFHIQIVGSVN
jgi:hypothetical protein